jgi:hypothetical protein
MGTLTFFIREEMPFWGGVLLSLLSLVLMSGVNHCDNFLVPPKLYITGTRSSCCRKVSWGCPRQEIIVITVLPENRDWLISTQKALSVSEMHLNPAIADGRYSHLSFQCPLHSQPQTILSPPRLSTRLPTLQGIVGGRQSCGYLGGHLSGGS